MRNLQHLSRFSFFLFLSASLHAQTLYDINTIQQIEIGFSQPNWDYQMDTAKEGSEGYILAEWAVINGVFYDSVGVKYKGNSSFDSTYAKNPMHISLNEFKDQSYEGYTDLKLGNGYSDPSMIREALAYSILQNYMDCPKSNYAQVYINGTLVGLFSNDESISKKFCSDHFYSSKNAFVKCNPQVTSAAYKSNLKYINADSSSYFIRYDLQSDEGWNELVALCDSLTNNSLSFASTVDIDRVIWMLAFNNVLVNLDSYSGAFAQNHYMYKDNTDHYNPVVWDLNMSFGGFPYAGSGAVGMGTLDTTGMKTMSPTLHEGDPYWPLIYNVMSNPMYKRMYIAHMRTIVDEIFASGNYLAAAGQLHAIINTTVQNDPNAFFTYAQFQAGLTDPITVSSHVVPGISALMDARVTFLQSTPELSFASPVISTVAATDTAPDYLGTFAITAQVTNANSNAVYFGYRFDKEQKFTRELMYDDGAHNDGAAGDNIFGSTAMTMSSARMQYYVYAENNDAGIFSPARAEHEFYSLNADIQTANAGEVVINEFLAVNQNDTVDENGAHEDWIELYNATPNPLNLFGLYLSDTYANLTKFTFPESSVIQPNGYFMIWADEDNTTTGDLHCNFKLSSNGEALFLSTGAGNILDSISFGTQTTDHAIGRCPNGTGPFIIINSPSFKEANHCTDGIEEFDLTRGISVYPNPASNSITVSSVNSEKKNFEILNQVGEIIFNGSFSSTLKLNTSKWSSGFYIFSCGEVKKKILVAH